MFKVRQKGLCQRCRFLMQQIHVYHKKKYLLRTRKRKHQKNTIVDKRIIMLCDIVKKHKCFGT